MFIDNIFPEASERCIDRGKLRQNIRTVFIILNHHLHMLKMSDRTRDPVQLLLFFLRLMIMSVSLARSGSLFDLMRMGDRIPVFIRMGMCMCCHALFSFQKQPSSF